jgi:hypothetical protein
VCINKSAAYEDQWLQESNADILGFEIELVGVEVGVVGDVKAVPPNNDSGGSCGNGNILAMVVVVVVAVVVVLPW